MRNPRHGGEVKRPSGRRTRLSRARLGKAVGVPRGTDDPQGPNRPGTGGLTRRSTGRGSWGLSCRKVGPSSPGAARISHRPRRYPPNSIRRPSPRGSALVLIRGGLTDPHQGPADPVHAKLSAAGAAPARRSPSRGQRGPEGLLGLLRPGRLALLATEGRWRSRSSSPVSVVSSDFAIENRVWIRQHPIRSASRTPVGGPWICTCTVGSSAARRVSWAHRKAWSTGQQRSPCRVPSRHIRCRTVEEWWKHGPPRWTHDRPSDLYNSQST
jgi:hypothetical protein